MVMHRILGIAFLSLLARTSAFAESDRFLYVVGCGAQLSKVDTSLGVKTDSVDLVTRTSGQRVIPEIRGVLDGCLTYQAVYDAKASLFYTVVPEQAESKTDGTKDYRILGFSVPAVRLENEMSAGDSLAEPPHLEIDEAGRVAVDKPSQWTPQTSLDLREYELGGSPPANQILEASGNCVLLRLFSGRGDGLTIGIADRKTKKLRLLNELPITTARNIHLAPGGQAVLVEEVVSSGASVEKTGRLILFDGSAGSPVLRLSEPGIKNLAFLAISPNGKAIYHRNDDYLVIALGRQFSGDPVSRPVTEGYPGFFFADR